MSSRVAARYAKSLLDLALEQKHDDRVYQEMNEIRKGIQESKELTALLNNPVVSASDKSRVAMAIFKDFSDITKKFINLVISKKREDDLSVMAEEYILRHDELKGVAKATVRSAIPLNNDAMDRVRKYLKGAVQKENIELENVIDKGVIGGMVIRFEDRLLDLSVAKELKEIRKQLIYN